MKTKTCKSKPTKSHKWEGLGYRDGQGHVDEQDLGPGTLDRGSRKQPPGKKIRWRLELDPETVNQLVPGFCNKRQTTIVNGLIDGGHVLIAHKIQK